MGASSTHTPETLRQGAHPTVRHAVEALLLEERTRWAMQIHDGLTQSVTSAVLELQTLRHRIETDPAGAASSRSSTRSARIYAASGSCCSR